MELPAVYEFCFRCLKGNRKGIWMQDQARWSKGEGCLLSQLLACLESPSLSNSCHTSYGYSLLRKANGYRKWGTSYLTKKTGAICEFFGMLATITIFNPCIAKVNNVNGNMSCCGKNPRLLSFKWNSFRVIFHIDSFSVITSENPSRDFFLCFAFLEMKGFRAES